MELRLSYRMGLDPGPELQGPRTTNPNRYFYYCGAISNGGIEHRFQSAEGE